MFVLATRQINKRIAGRLLTFSFSLNCLFLKHADVYCLPACYHMQIVSGQIYIKIPLMQRKKRSEEHTSELQSLMRHSYAVFCLKKKNNKNETTYQTKQ